MRRRATRPRHHRRARGPVLGGRRRDGASYPTVLTRAAATFAAFLTLAAALTTALTAALH
ncbi:hypothetical protein [Streptomyces sp. NPDC003996]